MIGGLKLRRMLIEIGFGQTLVLVSKRGVGIGKYIGCDTNSGITIKQNNEIVHDLTRQITNHSLHQ